MLEDLAFSLCAAIHLDVLCWHGSHKRDGFDNVNRFCVALINSSHQAEILGLHNTAPTCPFLIFYLFSSSTHTNIPSASVFWWEKKKITGQVTFPSLFTRPFIYNLNAPSSFRQESAFNTNFENVMSAFRLFGVLPPMILSLYLNLILSH